MYGKFLRVLLPVAFLLNTIVTFYVMQAADQPPELIDDTRSHSIATPRTELNQDEVNRTETKARQVRRRPQRIRKYRGPLTQANDRSALNKTKIVGFITGTYSRIAMRWYDRLEILGYDNHYIVTTDDETYQHFRTNHSHYRVEASYLPSLPEKQLHTNFRKKMRRNLLLLFAHRWRYLLNQLKLGNHILITDVDNIWNSFYNMNELELSEYDVFHALETRHPIEVFNEQGFVFCGGMGWFRSSRQTITFIQQMVNKCGLICDDQVLLNKVIAYDLNMTWKRTEEYHNETTADEETEEGVFPESWGDHLHRTAGLITRGFTGHSPVTGHKVKVWDRDFAMRGRNDPKVCPKNNWVSMPFVVMSVRWEGPTAKLNSYDLWDETCPNQYTNSTEGQKKDGKYYQKLKGT